VELIYIYILGISIVFLPIAEMRSAGA